jgi:hypothetical protein
MFYAIIGDALGATEVKTCVNRAQLDDLLQSLPDGMEGVMSLLPDMANRILVIEGRPRVVRGVTMPRYEVVGE